MIRLASWVTLALMLVSCEENCLGADEGCTVPSPCATLEYECEGGSATVRTLASGDAIPGGIDALAAPGDVVLENGVVTAVIDALDHPHYIAPTGGNLLDLVTAAGDDDSLTHVFQAVGLLPGDSVRYDRLVTESGDGFAAVQVHGALEGIPSVRVTTRYEIRPCEPGIRVRTEVFNGATEPRIWSVVDGWYWSGRETLPFAPGAGLGFEQPGIVSPVEDSWLPMPFMAAGAHADPAATYFAVACNDVELHGFHSEQVSGVGRLPRIVPPRDFEIFERFIGVVPGRAVGPAADQALEIRRALFGEPFVTIRGRVDAGGDVLGDEVRATIVISEGPSDAEDDERFVWTQVTPAADGTFSARVPVFGQYRLEVRAFGRVVAAPIVDVRGADVAVDPIAIDPAPSIALSVTVDGVADWAQVFVKPADDETEDAVKARLHAGFVECAPLLGSPTGGSPACDRVILNAPQTVRVPPGRYDVFATAGPFATVARETVALRAGETADVALALERLPIAPEGTLGADFHVHGGASFDSTVPDLDRVAAFLAANIEVIASTEHDVVGDYADARAALGADARMAIMIGLETTGHILFDLTPGNDIPQVIGHWNVWPLPFDPEGPWRGAPWDELAEPGALFDRFVEAGWPRETGIIQLNHPWAAAQFGRDLGFPRAVGVDARVPLPREYDGTGPGLVMRTPPGSGFANIDYHTQEIMNGSENEDLLPYRAYWFYLLNQGIIKAGTANSDSHGLVDNVVATPRNLVWTEQTVASFDEVAFNADVRAGRMIGTNGPILEARIVDGGDEHVPSTAALLTPTSSAMLALRVSAAPWVPIEEVRVIVNGEVARTLAAELTHPSDPFGTEGVVRFEGELALSELLPAGTRDAWIVVEAGAPLPLAGDLNCDGIPDTGDNDGSGVVDWRDVDRNDDDVVDARDLEEIDEAPDVCDPDQEIGPQGHPAAPARDSDAYAFYVVTPKGYPMSFTNPFLLNRDGGAFDGPGLPEAP